MTTIVIIMSQFFSKYSLLITWTSSFLCIYTKLINKFPCKLKILILSYLYIISSTYLYRYLQRLKTPLFSTRFISVCLVKASLLDMRTERSCGSSWTTKAVGTRRASWPHTPALPMPWPGPVTASWQEAAIKGSLCTLGTGKSYSSLTTTKKRMNTNLR